MANLPVVSVVVATYNRKALLDTCIQSLLSQNYPNLEVLVVNDGSSDGTVELLETYQKKDSRITFLTQQNKGIASARNSGIKKARGEIICFTDDDCIADRDWIKNLVKGFVDDSIGGVGGEVVGYKPTTLVERYVDKNKLLDQSNFINIFLLTANASFRKDVLERIKCFDENFYRMGGEDVDLGIKMLLARKALRYAPAAKVLHKHRSTLSGLMKQSSGYGRGYAFLHKKYPLYFNPSRRLSYFIRKIAFKFFVMPFRLFKAILEKDKALCLTEPILDILLISSELSGLVQETSLGKEYTGEKNYAKMDFIKKSGISNGWGL